MHLLDHVSIAVPDLQSAGAFYDAIMTALGCDKVYATPDALGYGERCRAATPDETYLAVYRSPAASVDAGRHWCFKAPSRAAVRAFHEAALRCGGSCDGPPGLRASYHPDYYAAFVLDPHGNRLEAVCHVPERRSP